VIREFRLVPPSGGALTPIRGITGLRAYTNQGLIVPLSCCPVLPDWKVRMDIVLNPPGDLKNNTIPRKKGGRNVPAGSPKGLINYPGGRSSLSLKNIGGVEFL
jgi:hypothetical protein